MLFDVHIISKILYGSPLALSVINAVTMAINALVYSVEEGAPYVDFVPLGYNVQWSVDFNSYETALDVYQDQEGMCNAQIKRTAIASMAFREMNGRLYEETLWEWSPLWRPSSSEDILGNMPSMPSQHNGYNLVNLHSRKFHFICNM